MFIIETIIGVAAIIGLAVAMSEAVLYFSDNIESINMDELFEEVVA